MAQIISASIDLTKIDKTKIQKFDKNGNPFKNGAQYYSVDIVINDDLDQFGNCCSITDKQTKEQREAKAKKTFLGNGKRVWMSKPAEETTATEEPANNNSNTEGDGLPF